MGVQVSTNGQRTALLHTPTSAPATIVPDLSGNDGVHLIMTGGGGPPPYTLHHQPRGDGCRPGSDRRHQPDHDRQSARRSRHRSPTMTFSWFSTGIPTGIRHTCQHHDPTDIHTHCAQPLFLSTPASGGTLVPTGPDRDKDCLSARVRVDGIDIG